MRYRTTCRDCGGPKDFNQQFLCRPCGRVYEAAMREANRIISNAKRAGLIPNAKTLDCVDCGGQGHDYDHRDYREPLNVQPVCRSCNIKRGPAEYDRTTLHAELIYPSGRPLIDVATVEATQAVG